MSARGRAQLAKAKVTMEMTETYPVSSIHDKEKTLLSTLPPELSEMQSRLSPERIALLQRTLEIRKGIGKVALDSTDVVRKMRESGE